MFVGYISSFSLKGETNRAVSEHTLNKRSSRSHCVFTIYIEVSFEDIPTHTSAK